MDKKPFHVHAISFLREEIEKEPDDILKMEFIDSDGNKRYISVSSYVDGDIKMFKKLLIGGAEQVESIYG
jgi:hypothetical protein